MTRFATALCAVLVPALAGAHPQHVAGGEVGLLHYLNDPFHVGLAAAAVVLLLVTRVPLRRAPARRRR